MALILEQVTRAPLELSLSLFHLKYITDTLKRVVSLLFFSALETRVNATESQLEELEKENIGNMGVFILKYIVD